MTRTFSSGDPQPASLKGVRDRTGRSWNRRLSWKGRPIDSWDSCSGWPKTRTWDRLLKEYGPVTEY